MLGHIGRFLWKVYRFRFILEYILYLPEAILTIAVGQTTGGSQTLGPCLTGEVQDARTHLVGLILIAGLLQYPADIMFHIFVYGSSLLDELLRRPLHNRPVLWTKMFGDGGVTVVVPVPGMMGDNVVVIADLHVGCSIGQLHFLADVDVRDAVVVDVFV